MRMKLDEKERLGKCLLLLLLQEDPMKLLARKDGLVLLQLLELKRPRQVLMENSEVGTGGFQYVEG